MLLLEEVLYMFIMNGWASLNSWNFDFEWREIASEL